MTPTQRKAAKIWMQNNGISFDIASTTTGNSGPLPASGSTKDKIEPLSARLGAFNNLEELQALLEARTQGVESSEPEKTKLPKLDQKQVTFEKQAKKDKARPEVGVSSDSLSQLAVGSMDRDTMREFVRTHRKGQVPFGNKLSTSYADATADIRISADAKEMMLENARVAEVKPPTVTVESIREVSYLREERAPDSLP